MQPAFQNNADAQGKPEQPGQTAGYPTMQPTSYQQVPPSGYQPPLQAGYQPVPPAGHQPVPAQPFDPYQPAPTNAQQPVQIYGQQPAQTYGQQPVQNYGQQPVPPNSQQPVPPVGYQPVPPAGHQPVPSQPFDPYAPQYGNQPQYGQPLYQAMPGQQINVIVQPGPGQIGQKGPGPYIGQTCCGCVELKCGVKFLAVVQILAALGLVIQTIVNFGYLQTYNDIKLKGYLAVWIILDLAWFIGAFLSFRWLIKDNLQTRIGLLGGFRTNFIAMVANGFWQTAGAYIMLGSSMHVYILELIILNTQDVDYQTAISLVGHLYGILFSIGMVISIIISIGFYIYWMTLAKRLIALWG